MQTFSFSIETKGGENRRQSSGKRRREDHTKVNTKSSKCRGDTKRQYQILRGSVIMMLVVVYNIVHMWRCVFKFQKRMIDENHQ